MEVIVGELVVVKAVAGDPWVASWAKEVVMGARMKEAEAEAEAALMNISIIRDSIQRGYIQDNFQIVLDSVVVRIRVWLSRKMTLMLELWGWKS